MNLDYKEFRLQRIKKDFFSTKNFPNSKLKKFSICYF